ncbi:MAG: hypothetical protein JNL79_14520 [Myxococcales bacterium]|nr:hypothetical protein [Myxococcales bacterium]
MQQGWGQPGQQPGYGATGGYEFNQTEDAVIGRLGGRARVYGVMSIVIGLLMMAAGVVVIVVLPGPLGLPVGAAVAVAALQPIVSGGFYAAAGSAFKQVVDTQGNDIPHVLGAVTKLTHAVRVEAIVAILATIAGLVIGFTLGSN